MLGHGAFSGALGACNYNFHSQGLFVYEFSCILTLILARLTHFGTFFFKKRRKRKNQSVAPGFMTAKSALFLLDKSVAAEYRMACSIRSIADAGVIQW